MGSSVSQPWCFSRHRKISIMNTISEDCQKLDEPKSIGLHVKPFKLPFTDRDCLSAVDLYNVLNDGNKYSCYIHDPLYVLLLDTRSMEDYKSNHIQSSFHCTAIASAFISQNITQYCHIVLYDTDSKLADVEHSQRAISILEDHELDFEVLVGGYTEFERRFPFMCNTKVAWTRKECECKLVVYPSLILEDWLYQGSGEQARNKVITDRIGITHILNITTEHECVLPNVKYLHIRLQDDGSNRLIEHFENIFEFLDGVKRTKGKALVHCNLGISRSSTATLSYIMLSECCSLADALSYLLHRRPVCSPNRGFFLQLGQFEEYIFGKSLTNASELWMAI